MARGSDQPPDCNTPDDYADWINARIGAEVRRRREALGLSAYTLGRACGVSDQTILNIEQGNCDRGWLTGTLARVAFHFGTTLSALITEAERGNETRRQ